MVRTRNFDRSPVIEQKDLNSVKIADLFSEVSDASLEAKELLDSLILSIGTLPTEPTEAIDAIRKHLIDNGFTYNNDNFTLQDVMQTKSGNCLGYALIFGAIFESQGVPVTYEVILHPKDAIDTEDQKLFTQLSQGEYFDYDKPVLPSLSEAPAYPIRRFAALEHPMITIDGKHFETTGLDDIEEDSAWMPEAERVKTVNGAELAGMVCVDRARDILNTSSPDLEAAKTLLERGVELWPENREALLSLYRLEKQLNNQESANTYAQEYASFDDTDSRFQLGMYEITEDLSHLEASLTVFPANILAFTEKDVLLEQDAAEAKFNLAVAAWCVANSSILSLSNFYETLKEKVIELYDEETYESLHDT